MKLYVTPRGRWTHRIDHAAKIAAEDGGDYRKLDVPTHQDGLLAFLNEHRVGATVPATPPRPRRDMSAEATLSRVDNPGVDVDAIVETIGKADGYALKRYAGAVALAFREIAS
jgi:hypothetical protein